jgi:hypothetical protein
MGLMTWSDVALLSPLMGSSRNTSAGDARSSTHPNPTSDYYLQSILEFV